MLSAQATPVYAHSAASSSPPCSPCPSPKAVAAASAHAHHRGEALYQHPTNTLLAKVRRSDSLRSEDTASEDQSSSAENRRVSFNADVTVKKIPKSRLIGGIGSRGNGLIDAASRPTFSTFKVTPSHNTVLL